MFDGRFLRTYSIGSHFVSLLVCLCCIQGQCQYILPSTTSNYYTVVSAGFGTLGFSFHFEEYGSTTKKIWQSVSRYYAPGTQEWTNAASGTGTYYLSLQPFAAVDPSRTPGCQAYALDNVKPVLFFWNGASSLLGGMTSDMLNFDLLPNVVMLRSQSSRQYTRLVAYPVDENTQVPPTYQSVDAFLKAACSTHGVDTSLPYTVNVTVDVYFACQTDGELITAGDGNVPLTISITGTRIAADSTSLPLNILYEFMNWAQLSDSDIEQTLAPPKACAPHTDPLPNIPSFGPIISNSTTPIWVGGRGIVELTATTSNSDTSIPTFLQFDSLVNLTVASSIHPDPCLGCVGQQLIQYVQDRNAGTWDSDLYVYNSSSFIGGVVYHVQESTIPDIFLEQETVGDPSDCTSSLIDNSNVSPLQWLLGDSVVTMYAFTSYLSGATYVGMRGIRSISTDMWSIGKPPISNGEITYSFTLNIYAISSKWGNMGRLLVPSWERQLLRLEYIGQYWPNSTPNQKVDYTLRLDFFNQHDGPYYPNANLFSIAYWGCPLRVETSGLATAATAVSLSSLESAAVSSSDMFEDNANQSVTNSSVSILVAGVVSAAAAAGYRWWNMKSSNLTQVFSKYFDGAVEHAKVQ